MGQPVQRVAHKPLHLVAELRLAAGHAQRDEQQRRPERRSAPEVPRRRPYGRLHEVDDLLRVGVSEVRAGDSARGRACTVVADRKRRQDEGHGERQRSSAKPSPETASVMP